MVFESEIWAGVRVSFGYISPFVYSKHAKIEVILFFIIESELNLNLAK